MPSVKPTERAGSSGQRRAPAPLRAARRKTKRWAGEPAGDITVTPGAPIESGLHTEDADSDLLLEADCAPMTEADYAAAKLLVLKSARDFCALFESIPNPDISPRAPRTSFYGPVPRTPREMYDHTNSTTAYYMAAFGIPFENMPDLYANRLQALAEIEDREELLTGKVCTAPDGERWTLRKLLRRFLWHDRIHARAMWRTAAPLWGSAVADPFGFR